ncbi:MAG: Hpt domain-containing protein [Pseudomonadota bacterium]|nr:Hpt domain-containing protein [Pseudomonadota bacterium]
MQGKTRDNSLPVYDPALATRVAGGNPQTAADLLALFLRELPMQEEALHEAFAAADLKQLREVSHRLNGSATYCAMPALRAATQALQAVPPGASTDQIGPAYRQVLEEIHRIQAAGLTRRPAAG